MLESNFAQLADEVYLVGLKEIYRTKYLWVKVFWTIFLVLGILGTGYYLHGTIIEFVELPTAVKVSNVTNMILFYFHNIFNFVIFLCHSNLLCDVFFCYFNILISISTSKIQITFSKFTSIETHIDPSLEPMEGI